MKPTYRTTAAAITLLWLSGCVSAPKPLYSWEGFPHHQYQTLLMDGYSPDEQIRELEAQAERARAEGKNLPPGFRAHLGMLYSNTGNAGAARSMWQAEKTTFPESSFYMDSLLKKTEPKETAQEKRT